MSDLLLQHLDLIAAAPDGVKRLRELILELAVRGKLAPQDPNDEPASELLKRIQAEKAWLVAEGKIRKDKPLPVIGEDEKPFELPVGWEWVFFGTVMISRDGERIPVSKEERDHREKIYDYYGASGVIDKIDEFLFDKPLLLIGEDGANLINRSTPIAFIARGEYWVNNHAHVLDGTTEDFLRYIELHINAVDLMPYVTGTAQPKMNQAKMNSIPIALPPETEQLRILAKVDELMALCDQLEAQQIEGGKAHATLVKTLLDTLTTSSQAVGGAGAARPDRFQKPVRSDSGVPSAPKRMDDGSNSHWERIAHHFDTLFTTKASIDALKQTILQLAVMGKLEPQDPNDEPAFKILGRDRVLEDLLANDIPIGWTLTKLSALAEINGGFAFKSTDYTNDGIRVVRISDFDEFGFKDHKIVRHYFSPELNRFSLAESNILMAMTGGTVGKSYLVKELPEPMVVNQRVATIKVSEKASPRYVDIVIRAEGIQAAIREAKNSTNDNISMSDIKGFDIPLPPLPEQLRIVAKVDELMALCDQLADRLKAARERSGQYATAATRSALEAA
jgi:type I restriction enzyme S subunit